MPPTSNGRLMNGVGFVYLIRLDRYHKIGSSKNPAKRLKSFDNLPWRPVLVHSISSARSGFVERLLHRRFATQRIRGEWFDLDAATVQRLCAVARLDGLDDFPDDLLPHPSFWIEPSTEANADWSRVTLSLDTFALIYDLMRVTRPRLTVERMVDSLLRAPLQARYQQLIRECREDVAVRHPQE